jgi:hypothetical protein
LSACEGSAGLSFAVLSPQSPALPHWLLVADEVLGSPSCGGRAWETASPECGDIIRRRWFTNIEDSPGKREWQAVVAGGEAVKGDSGAPVWNPETQEEVGLVTLLGAEPGKPCHKTTIRGRHTTACPRVGVTPLLPFRGKANPEGITEKLGVSMVLK